MSDGFIYDGISVEEWTKSRLYVDPSFIQVFSLREHARHWIRGADARGDYWELKERKVRAGGFTFTVWVFLCWRQDRWGEE